MIICSINADHEPSVCLLHNGKVIWYNEERKLTKVKEVKGIPFSCLESLSKIPDILPIDKFLVTGYNFNAVFLEHVDSFLNHLELKTRSEKSFGFFTPHHLSHAFKAFYDSNFKKARVFVVDGRGSDWYLTDKTKVFETCSIYDFDEKGVRCIFKKLYSKEEKNSNCTVDPTFNQDYFSVEKFEPLFVDKNTKFEITNKLDLGHFYFEIAKHFNFEFEEGKFMGYQSAGQYNESIYKKLINGVTTKDISDLPKTLDTAKTAQIYFENFYKKLVKDFEADNMVFTGGTALNVVNNYKLQKTFSSKKLWFDPLCTDVGNSIGNAYCYLHQLNQKITPLKNIYIGERIKKHRFNFRNKEKLVEVGIEDVVKILEQGHVVGLFQGRAEAGPRALGNRSLLLDPTIKNAKDKMNKIKKRESFRPFACSILESEASKYFEMENIKSTPFMMHAPQAKDISKKIIPSLVHNDNTCRIQTVTSEYNEVLNNILSKFKLPIIMNTSFNLSGRPIIETITDAFFTMRNSELNYIYFPDINGMVIKDES